jgi:hypothetical protein
MAKGVNISRILPKPRHLNSITSDDDDHEVAVKNYIVASNVKSRVRAGQGEIGVLAEFLDQMIQYKCWEKLYVHQTRTYVAFDLHKRADGTNDDQLNFLDFIRAYLPEGLHSTPEVIERLIKDDPETLERFRQLAYASRQGERNDIATSGIEGPKLENVAADRTQKRYRAVHGDTNGREGAPPIIRDLYKQELINLDLAAKLGAKNPDSDRATKISAAVTEIEELVDSGIPESKQGKKEFRQKVNQTVRDHLGISTGKKLSLPADEEQAADILMKELEEYEGDIRKLITIVMQRSCEAIAPSNPLPALNSYALI